MSNSKNDSRTVDPRHSMSKGSMSKEARRSMSKGSNKGKSAAMIELSIKSREELFSRPIRLKGGNKRVRGIYKPKPEKDYFKCTDHENILYCYKFEDRWSIGRRPHSEKRMLRAEHTASSPLNVRLWMRLTDYGWKQSNFEFVSELNIRFEDEEIEAICENCDNFVRTKVDEKRSGGFMCFTGGTKYTHRCPKCKEKIAEYND